MKDGDRVLSHIRTDTEIQAVPAAVAEWNYNLLVKTDVANGLDEEQFGYDVDLFPIESIVEAYRPERGIVKALVGEGKISKGYYDAPNASRYYLASVDDIYKYWLSGVQTNDSGVFAQIASGVSVVSPTVLYDVIDTTAGNRVNKIVVGVETGWARPTVYNIQVLVGEDETWQTIATQDDVDIANNGRITLYLNDDGWREDVDRDLEADIRGVRFNVFEMDKKNAHCSIIEISARIEVDLTPYLVSMEDTFDLGEDTEVSPIGKASSNLGTLTLFNDLVDPDRPEKGALFNDANPYSKFHNMIDTRAHVTGGYHYTIIDKTGEPEYPYVQAFDMYTEIWEGQTSSTLTIPLRDRSLHFQETKPPKTLFTNRRVSEIVYMLCDIMGFSDYIIDELNTDVMPIVPYFWTDGEQTLWEVFADLSEGTQTAIFFDAYGMLHIKSCNAAFDPSRPVDWTLRGEDFINDAGELELADISDYSQTEKYEANYVTVNYHNTGIGDFQNGIPEMQQVWEPTETTVLRSSNLLSDLLLSDDFIVLQPRDAKVWPFTGIMQIEGELIKYDGKQYIYYQDGKRKLAIVKSIEEQQKLDAFASDKHTEGNKYSGKLKIDTRGYLNSDPQRHLVEANGYHIWDNNVATGALTSTRKYFVQNKQDSTVTIQTPTYFQARHYILAEHGVPEDQGFYEVGTMMKFEKDRPGQQAGIVWNSGTKQRGYYLEFRPTRLIKPNDGAVGSEVYFYSMKEDGTTKSYGGETQKIDGKPVDVGVSHYITEDLWFTTDVYMNILPNFDHQISIFVDGQLAMNFTITHDDPFHNTLTGRLGMFVRNRTTATYEYLYGIGRPENPRGDDMSFLDRITSGYIGNQLQKEWVYRIRDPQRRTDKKSKAQGAKYGEMFIDEFGPICHEVREFEVLFDPKPVVHSFLYVTNESQIICPQYRADSFGAQFMLVNAARQNAVLEGDDTLSFPGSTIQQKSLIFGRVVTQQDAESIVVKNDDAIRARGKVELGFDSKWIQTKEQAKQIGEFVSQHWSNSNDECEVTIFGNPMFELGDVVAIDYPDAALFEDKHEYFVISTSTTFDGGMETNLKLRRRKIQQVVEEPPPGGGEPAPLIYVPELIVV